MRRREKITFLVVSIMLLLTSSAFHTAAADQGFLNVEKLAIPPAAQDETKGEPAATAEQQSGEDPDAEERRRIYAQIPDDKKPSRFSLEQRQYFRPWLSKLCDDDAVAETESKRVRFGKFDGLVEKPNKKLGTFKLLLENYIADVEVAAKCGAMKTEHRELECLVHYSKLHQREWVSFASWKAIDKAEAEKSSSLIAWNAIAKGRRDALKDGFRELNEVNKLDGKPASIPLAREILKAVIEDQTCSLRAVKTSKTTLRELYRAQK